MPTISVIVPVYNAERWLRRCVDSILAQTFTDFELLLIDDGSTDASGAIADAYAAADPRVRTFHKPNGGVSSARNLGLDHARAPWITFVDSDDCVAPQYLTHLYNQPGEDLHISLFWIDSPNGMSTPCAPTAIFDQRLSLQQSIDTLTWKLWTVCCNLYRRDLIEKSVLRFKDNLSMGEDTFFNYGYLAVSRSSSICRYFDYRYLQDNALSLSKQPHTLDEIALFASMTQQTLAKFPADIDITAAHRALGRFIIDQLLSINADRKTFRHYRRQHKSVAEALRDNSCGIRRRLINRLISAGFYRTARKIRG